MADKPRCVHRNRQVELTLDDILDLAAGWSGAGHPHDFIDRDTAQIKLRRNPTRVEITWEGFPTDDPEYLQGLG